MDWRQFVPVAARQLRATFKQHDWQARHENPLVYLFDAATKAHYYYNRSTGERCDLPNHTHTATPTTHTTRPSRILLHGLHSPAPSSSPPSLLIRTRVCGNALVPQ